MERFLLAFFLPFFFIAGNAQENFQPFIEYPKPYEYRRGSEGYEVKAFMSGDRLTEQPVMLLDGEKLNYHKTPSGSFEVYLPLTGSSQKMTIQNGKNTPNEQTTFLFEPLIPDDWGYFKNGRIHIICSSHQDIAWMNTPDSCRMERVHDIVIPALDLIERKPEFRFEMEQSLNLMEVLEDAPEQRQRIIDAYQSGHFDWGATFTQPYEGLESGEQLVRQAYLGRRWIKKELPGMDAKVAYNIDVPGRSLQVPQIFKKAGIDYLFVTRMKEGFYNWHSPDGTKIFTYSPGNYGWAFYVYKYLEEDAVNAMHKLYDVIKERENYYRERNLPPEYALVISADAGGPEDYIDLMEDWNEIAGAPGVAIPEIRHSTAEGFFHTIDVPGIQLDSIYGERPNLWLYIHGAAHYQAIKAKREAAVNLPAAEIFQTINCQLEEDFHSYPQDAFFDAWFKSIYPDHGWGGKNGEITDSIFRASLEQGNAAGKKLLRASLRDISGKINLRDDHNVIVYNDLSWERDGVARVDVSQLEGNEWSVETPDGDPVPLQVEKTDTGRILVFFARDIPSLGYKTYRLTTKKQTYLTPEQGANFYENDYYVIEFGRGGIKRLYDKELDKEVFQTTRFPGGDLFHLGYSGNGAGEFVQITQPNYHGMERGHEKPGTWKQIASGPVYTRFATDYKMDGFSVIQTITVFHDRKQIDFEYDIPDWNGTHNRQLRVLFPLKMEPESRVSYDVPMGMVHVGEDELKMRPQGWAWGGTYWQKPEEIHPREIQNFMSINSSEMGVTVSTDVVTADWIDPSREAVDFPVMNFVLLSTHKSCHGEGNWYHQTGSHTFHFSLTSHQPGWKNGFHFGVTGNHPLHALRQGKNPKGTLPHQKSFVHVSDPFARITTIKKAEDSNDIIMRILEAAGEPKEVEVTTFWESHDVFKTNLIEDNPVGMGQQGNRIQILLDQNAIETYKMTLKE